jgi:prepilin-type processing-associated H-X9-DG protein
VQAAGKTNSMPESYIKDPTETILFGEKKSLETVTHFYMDIMEPPNGNDLDFVEESRHMSQKSDTIGSGGSNFAFVDGHSSYLISGRMVVPKNLWGVTELWRNSYINVAQ